MNTYIIAEAGANHNGDFDQALKLIDIAAQAGASACKFQTYSADTLYSKNTPDFAGYRDINALMKSIELNRDWQKDLMQYASERFIDFLSTPFDAAAVEQLAKIGVKKMKIAGFEASDLHFVKMVAETHLPLVISVGIGIDFPMINRIIETCEKAGNQDITLLHCNNAYPTPQSDINLGTMQAIGKEFARPFGLSDHTLSPLTPSLAVALGASMIEKHFTLSKKMQGPDHQFALEPDQLAEMVQAIRLAEQSLGMKEARFTESEQAFGHARRSIVAHTDLPACTVLTDEMLTTKRPFFEGNIPAHDYDLILGKKTNCAIEADTPILRHWVEWVDE